MNYFQLWSIVIRSIISNNIQLTQKANYFILQNYEAEIIPRVLTSKSDSQEQDFSKIIIDCCGNGILLYASHDLFWLRYSIINVVV